MARFVSTAKRRSRSICSPLLFIGVMSSYGCLLLTDTEGLSGGARADALGEAGLETSTDSTTVITDGGGDSTSSNIDASGGCNALGQHALCDDFDTAELGGLWDSLSMGAGSVTKDTDASVSPPYSALFISSAAVGGPGKKSALAKTFPSKQQVRVSADMRVDQHSSGGGQEVTLLKINFDPPPIGFQTLGANIQFSQLGSILEIYVRDASGNLLDESVPITDVFAQWHRWTLEASLDTRDIVVLLDGAIAAKYKLGVDGGALSSRGELVNVGTPDTIETPTPFIVRYDNVTVDVW